MRGLLITALAIVGAHGAAFAQGEPELCFDKGTLTYKPCPEPEAAPEPVVVVEEESPWTGFHIGIHGGLMYSSFDGFYDSLGDATPYDEVEGAFGLIGGQVGYDIELDSGLVVGGEFAFGFGLGEDRFNTAGGENQSVEGDISFLLDLRGRVGVALDDFLPYVTAGAAFVDYTVGAVDPGATPTRFEEDEGAFGFVVGGGVDVLAVDGFILRAEGLYYVFDNETDIGNRTNDSDPADRVTLDDLLVGRLAVNYKF